MGWSDVVPDIELHIGEEVDDLLNGFGKTITVHPYSAGSANLYGQTAKGFGTDVPCTGRCILNPTAEQLSIIGNMQEVDVAVLFSRREMIRKFPAAAENEWMTERDELSFEGLRYKIIKVHTTARVADKAHLLVVLCKDRKGKFRQ